VTAADSLAAQLEDIAAAIERARAFEHEHGLSSSRTRKLPADALRSLHRWQQATEDAAQSATVCNTAATAPRDNGQPTAGQQQPDTCQGAPTVPASPTVGVRIPPALLERAEDQAHREDRTLSQLIRRALTQHVGEHDHRPTEGQRAA
jgi:predicted transcriptional regulator